MAKSNNEVSITVQVDPAGLVPLLEMIRDDQEKALKNTEQMIANLRTDKSVAPDPEIYVIDAAALPAEYYLRESVQAAILGEIRKDYKKSNQLPAGASLKNEVEARSGETEKISDKKNDSVEPGTGPENPGGRENNGSETGGGDPDTSGLASESDSERSSESGKGPSQ
jgi:hypothetical protein